MRFVMVTPVALKALKDVLTWEERDTLGFYPETECAFNVDGKATLGFYAVWGYEILRDNLALRETVLDFLKDMELGYDVYDQRDMFDMDYPFTRWANDREIDTWTKEAILESNVIPKDNDGPWQIVDHALLKTHPDYAWMNDEEEDC